MTDNRSDYTILVVEDTELLAQLIIDSLKHAGFQAVHAIDGEAALEYLATTTPDLMLLDLNLPGLSGWDVMKHMVAEKGEDAVPVIVTTAYGDPANRVIGKLQHVKDYLVKPFEVPALIRTVEEVLGLESA